MIISSCIHVAAKILFKEHLIFCQIDTWQLLLLGLDCCHKRLLLFSWLCFAPLSHCVNNGLNEVIMSEWVSEWVIVAQSCSTLCDPMNSSPPSSSVYGILQARILEWVAIFFSRGSSWPRNRTWVSEWQADSLSSGSPGKPTIKRHF